MPMRKRANCLCLALALLCSACVGTDYDSYIWSRQGIPSPMQAGMESRQAAPPKVEAGKDPDKQRAGKSPDSAAIRD